jgi:hypothetical protein
MERRRKLRRFVSPFPLESLPFPPLKEIHGLSSGLQNVYRWPT